MATQLSNQKTSNDEITMSDFVDFCKDMPDPVKEVFNLVLPISILEEAEKYKKASTLKTKSERIKTIEALTMLRLAQIAVS